MASHHFIGNGRISAALSAASAEPERLIAAVSAHVRSSGLEVVGHQAVPFPDDGLTLVWVLAESHLVLHHWAAEGYATLDLHVCDYNGSNAGKASKLVELLTQFCFVPGSERWREVHLESPARLEPVAG